LSTGLDLIRFKEDKLVEAPYLGMEHQSSVTYGNGFKTDIEEGI
jgi:hypothetical protein